MYSNRLVQGCQTHLIIYLFNTRDSSKYNPATQQETTLFNRSGTIEKVRLAATALGPDFLGFTADQIGLHSARSGAAMAMFLSGVPVFQIMLLGQWASNAFLRYIRKQVKEFSAGISHRMITKENFFTIPSSNSSADENGIHCRTASQNLIGPNFSSTVKPLARAFC
jgi:hypothetical protein